MGAVLHGITDCPKCGSQNSRVIMTKPVTDGPFALVRRRVCKSCDHRWYTAQAAEVYAASVDWSGTGPRGSVRRVYLTAPVN